MQLAAAVLCTALTAAQQPTRVVRIGLFEPDAAWAERIQTGALEAAAEWNRNQPADGFQLELVRVEPAPLWRGAGALLARTIVEEKLQAVIGPSRSADAHMAAQVATRLRVPIITLSSDATLTAAKDPWIFRAMPSDREQALALLRATLPEPAGKTVRLVVPSQRAGRVRLQALRAACAELNVRPTQAVGPSDAVLLWLDAEPALTFLAANLDAKDRAPLLGSLRLRRAAQLASLAAGAVQLRLPRLTAPSQNLGAALGYDAVTAIAEAAQSSGTSRAAIRAGLTRLSLNPGHSGLEAFDDQGGREGTLRLQTIGPRGATCSSPAPALDAECTVDCHE